jgi:adenylate cyclase
LSAAAVIESEIRLQSGEKPSIEPSAMKNCYVLFGYSAPGLMDLRPSPMSEVYPGVEIHATALDNMLSGRFLREVPLLLALLITLVMSFLGSGLVVYSRKTVHIVLTSACMIPLALAAGFAAYAGGYWLPVVVTTLGVVIALSVGVIVNYQAEGRQKAFIKQAFKQYLGAEVIEQLIADPSRLKLGGEKRELTLFFSDIEKFSSFSERLDPPTLTALLNDFFSDMTGIILNEGGYLDKYIGDAIVAFWNAPVTQQDHAIRACRSVVLCQRKLAARRQEFFDRTGVTIKMRMGINTGAVVVGNMGSRERFNYTVLGDAANLASRLEGANKAFGTYAMVSGTTWDLLGGMFIGREIARLRVVGRQLPVRVHELTGFAGEAVPAHYAAFNEGLQKFYKGGIEDALKIFESIKNDPVSESYCVRCRKLAGQGIETETWDGVLNLTEK